MAARKQLKKDFSKEAMYRKIMPSISSAPEYGAEAGEEPRQPREEPDFPIDMPCNVMELVVRSKLPQTMETLGACSCGQCRNDALALALNLLPPSYAVTEPGLLGERARRLRANNEIKITAAIIRAVQAVMARPRH